MTTPAHLYKDEALKMPPKIGWPPGMLQDDCRKLSIWLANRVDSRRHAREAAASLGRLSATPADQKETG